MGEQNERHQLIVDTLRRCRGQFARPPGITRASEQEAIDLGLLRFVQWPSGHYEITPRGHEYLAERV